MKKNIINIWGYCVPAEALDASTKEYLNALPEERPSVQWVWIEMDRVWDDIFSQVKTHAESLESLRRYYSHPVWVMNGLFTATDQESIAHRNAIANCVAMLKPKYIIDYGGGFGILAQALAEKLPDARIQIFEPFASPLGRAAIEPFTNVSYSSELADIGDVLIAQDVLEHVENPMDLVIKMAQAVKPGGYLVFANCFWPVIRCHLQETFYLRYTFRFVMRGLGLNFIGVVPDASHAEVYRRNENLNFSKFRKYNKFALIVGGKLSFLEDHLRQAWRRIRNR